MRFSSGDIQRKKKLRPFAHRVGDQLERRAEQAELTGESARVFSTPTYGHIIPSLQRDGADKLGAVLLGTKKDAAEARPLN